MARVSMCLVCRLIGCCGRGVGSRIGDMTMGVGSTLSSGAEACGVMGTLDLAST